MVSTSWTQPSRGWTGSGSQWLQRYTLMLGWAIMWNEFFGSWTTPFIDFGLLSLFIIDTHAIATPLRFLLSRDIDNRLLPCYYKKMIKVWSFRIRQYNQMKMPKVYLHMQNMSSILIYLTLSSNLHRYHRLGAFQRWNWWCCHWCSTFQPFS